ncbi:MAG: hypothetical protein D6820_05855 [Lentisphaerae bacterium]|nr:MAG: hypothetical protein D6820_05855 [Lentisphaerota bacterium]
MMTRQNNPPASRKRYGRERRGSAIILTIGILSLMLIITIVFAFDARNERKAAENYANTIRARLLAESGLNRAVSMIGALSVDPDHLGSPSTFEQLVSKNRIFLHPASTFRNTFSGFDIDSPRFLVSLTGSGSDSYTANIIDALGASFPVYGDYRLAPYNIFAVDTSISLPGNVAWVRKEIVADNSNWGKYTPASDSTVVGAFSYLIQDCTGYLDPTLMSDSASTAFVDSSVEAINIRDCVYPSGSGAVWAAFADNTSRTMLDLYHYLPYSYASSYQGVISTNFFPGQIADTEQFWVEANGDSYAFDTELMPRLSLPDITSDLPGSNSAQKAEALYKFLVTGDVNGDPSNTTVSDSTTGSPWFRTFHQGDTYVSSLLDAKRAAAQLALNIIDYTDGPSAAPLIGYIDGTGNLTVTEAALNTGTAGTADAVVHGVDNSWGVSEIYLGCQVTDADATATVVFKLQVEATNPFGSMLSLSSPPLQCSVRIDWAVSTGIPSNVTGATTATLTLNNSLHGGHLVYNTLAIIPSGVPVPVNGTGCTITYSITRLTIRDGANILREYPVYHRGKNSTGALMAVTSGAQIVPPATSGEWGTTIQAIDPLFVVDATPANEPNWDTFWRSILDPDPSKAVVHTAIAKEIDDSGFTPYVSGLTGAFALGKYSTIDCPPGGGTFAHLGKIGRVHSADKPLQSLRLWINNPSTDGTYTDAMLLDMFHGNNTTSVPGRLNPNCSMPGPLMALIKKVFNSGTISYATGDERSLVTKWLVANGSLPAASGGPYRPFLYRGEIYKIFDQSLATTGGNEVYTGVTGNGALFDATNQDEAVEDALGQVVNLLSTRPTYYAIVVTGQAIRDIGNAPGVAGAVQIGTSRYGIVEGRYKIFAQVYRDAWTGETRILSQAPLEE